MKPTLDFDANVLDNASAFRDPFYRRFTLRRAPKPLRLSDSVEKDYLFPTLYGDVTCAQAIFTCSYAKASELMLHPRIEPVRAPGGRALVAFSCYDYKQVLGVAPYHEIAMTIPVLLTPRWSPPVLPLVIPGFPGFGYYVFSMPVTSLENQIRGRKIWGLPKVVEEIELLESGGEAVTTAKDASGETYFTLRVPTAGAPKRFDVRSNLYSRLDDRLLCSETCFAATFAVTKNLRALLGRTPPPPTPFLTIGKGPSADALRALEIDPQPVELRFARGMTSCFDLPDPSFRAPFAFA